jgi:hypothetical protein
MHQSCVRTDLSTVRHQVGAQFRLVRFPNALGHTAHAGHGPIGRGLANEQTEGPETAPAESPAQATGNPGRLRYRQATGAGQMVSRARQRAMGARDGRGHRSRVRAGGSS